MKKIIAILFASLTVMLAFASCGEDGNATDSENKTSSKTSSDMSSDVSSNTTSDMSSNIITDTVSDVVSGVNSITGMDSSK